MKLKDEQLLEIYDTLEREEHPDPVGFIARSEILSKLNTDFSSSDRVGISGIKKEQLSSLGINSNNFADNLSAAVKTDLDNFSKYSDIADMHVAFRNGEVTERKKRPQNFLRSLNKKKKKIGTRLEKLRQERGSGPIEEGVGEDFTQDFDDAVVTPEAVETPARVPTQQQLPIESAPLPQPAQASPQLQEASLLSQQRQPQAQPETSFGDPGNIARIRDSFKGLNVPKSELPQRKTSLAREKLRKVIRKALSDA